MYNCTRVWFSFICSISYTYPWFLEFCCKILVARCHSLQCHLLCLILAPSIVTPGGRMGCHSFMLALSRQHLMESCMVLIHFIWETIFNKTSCAGGRHNMPPPPASWPLTLKLVSKSRVTWATSVPILVFLGLSVLDLGPMYVTVVRQTSDAHHRLMPPTLGAGRNKMWSIHELCEMRWLMHGSETWLVKMEQEVELDRTETNMHMWILVLHWKKRKERQISEECARWLFRNVPRDDLDMLMPTGSHTVWRWRTVDHRLRKTWWDCVEEDMNVEFTVDLSRQDAQFKHFINGEGGKRLMKFTWRNGRYNGTVFNY